MKKKLSLSVLFMFIFSCFSVGLFAQEEQQMYLVFGDKVKPGTIKQYEDMLKKHVELYKKYDFEVGHYSYSTLDNVYYWSVPIKKMADIDVFFEKHGAFQKLMKENNEPDLQAMQKDLYDYMLPQIYIWSQKLSYAPEEPRLKDGEAKFHRWWFCYLHPGHEQEFYKMQVEYVKYFKDANLNSGFNTLVGYMGTKMPLVVYVESYKDQLDMVQTRKEIFEKVNPKALELWKEMRTHIRKIEVQPGWSRPELSYWPDKE